MADYSPNLNGSIPLADAVDNDTPADVVGNKTDTVAGTSLVALIKQILVRLLLPAADAAANVTPADVIGNKDDTTAGTSLISRIKQALAALGIIDGYHDVPATDSAANTTIRDVIGSKLDRSYNGGNSIFAAVHTIEEHAHSASWVLPDRAAAVQATAGNGWAYGAASASLGTPTDHFDVHWVEILAGANAEYQGVILVDGVEVCEFAFTRVAAGTRSFSKRVQMVDIAPGPITIKLAASVNGATATFKVEGHNY